jgi:hypothetical protein
MQWRDWQAQGGYNVFSAVRFGEASPPQMILSGGCAGQKPLTLPTLQTPDYLARGDYKTMVHYQ